MSRRPAAGADRAAQNAQTLKALVKLEGNKVCADCKRNKHPRWASWNLGVFVCIRCSGIHRGMGTHISRVKSVDLDAWTDEQLQSVLKWGNTRANKYWEAKLAPGHVPSDAKIENFIRTKYETKRWAMDGPIPDPSTLDTEGDDDVPLSVVQEKAKIERSASLKQRQPHQTTSPNPQIIAPPQSNVDLFGDFSPPQPAAPARSAATDLASPPTTNKSKPASSGLAGLDFFGGSQSAGIGRPNSAASNPSSNPRGDLKNSILSLYASAPKPQPAPVQTSTAAPASQQSQSSFDFLSGMTSSPPPPKKDAFGGLTDAFGGMNFSSTSSNKSPPPISNMSAFSGMTFPTSVSAKATPSAPQVTSPPPLSGGSFFDSAPSKPPMATDRKSSNGLNFGFASNSSASTTASKPTTQSLSSVKSPTPTSLPVDLFSSDDFGGFASDPKPSAPTPAASAPMVSPPITSPSANFSSPFNLSASQASAPKPAVQPTRMPSATGAAMFDPWASTSDSSPWGNPSPPKQEPSGVSLGKVPSRITPNDISGSWGNPISKPTTVNPTVTKDEDFGGWSSALPTQAPAPSKPPKSGGGFAGAADPFDNPWG